MIDETLTWIEQVSFYYEKSKQRLQCLAKITEFLDKKISIPCSLPKFSTDLTSTIVPRCGEALVPHFAINFNGFRVDMKFGL